MLVPVRGSRGQDDAEPAASEAGSGLEEQEWWRPPPPPPPPTAGVRKELMEMGFPDDGYDYSRHMRSIEPSGAKASGLQAVVLRPPAGGEPAAALRPDVRVYDASGVAQLGEASRAPTAQRVNADARAELEEVMAALESSGSEVEDDDDEEMEDDFVLRAAGGPAATQGADGGVMGATKEEEEGGGERRRHRGENEVHDGAEIGRASCRERVYVLV